MSTKNRIRTTAIEQFNAHGFHQVTILDLARACGMSRGNLAYHYKTKIYLLNDLIVKMIEEVRVIQSERRDYPAFSNLALDIRSYKMLQDKYRFLFRDSSVLEHKHVRRILNIWSELVIKRNKEAFAFGLSVGNVQPEVFDGMYHQLAINTWMITFYWVSQQSVRHVEDAETAEKMVWSMIFPHFTDQGRAAFESFYGKRYISEMGQAIQASDPARLLF